jgi:uncharacterized membrane protein
MKGNEVLIALEVGGREFSTEKLAETMKGWMLEGNDIVLAIGGPDGHSEAVRKAAAWHWSLSKLTLPHPMVRVMLIEQLYRAMSINHNHLIIVQVSSSIVLLEQYVDISHYTDDKNLTKFFSSSPIRLSQ